jgi:restriction system protein
MKDMGVSDKEQSIRNSSGEPTVRNRLRWGIHYLKHAKLMDKPSRGRYVITERGRKIRKERGLDITNKTLMEFDEFREFKKPTKVTDEVSTKGKIEELTPIESLESLSNIIKSEVKSELRNQIFSLSPYFFEKLVVDLLKKMGYGSYQGTGVTSKSGDGGIDGIVYQDVLGLDIVYIQAKRYKEGNNIGSDSLQKFSGALSGLKATKGIFFTTSDFTPSANKFLNTTPQNIVTVNGDKLLNLLIEYEVGVEVMTSHNTFKVNEDYFSE